MQARHAGKLGDLVYGIAVIRAVHASDLYLYPIREFTDVNARLGLELARSQPSLGEVRLWEDQAFNLDLDEFRKFNVYWTNLADAQRMVVSALLRQRVFDGTAGGISLGPELREGPWLHFDIPACLTDRNVVFARSQRNHGPVGFWPEAMRLLLNRAVFVGTPEEYKEFTDNFGEIPFYPTEDLIELARIIAGCSLFVGNQSCPFAIAEGLKKSVIQETDLVTPNCLFMRENSLSVRLPGEIALIEPFIRKLEAGWEKPDSSSYANPLTLVRNIRPMASPEELEAAILKAKRMEGKTESESAEPKVQIPVAMVVHDDWFFLREAIRAYQEIGPVTVFVSLRAWNGDDGRWDKCASEAESVDAEVIIGDWPDEAFHRRVALETMRQRGHKHILIPDGDEIVSKQLLQSLVNLASVDAADVVRVSMETYWKSPRYRIQPPERLRPVLMVNAQTVRHDYIREYEGPRLLVLGPDHGVLHHLSYAGPDERIQRKLSTWGHRSEVAQDWFQRVWKGWDKDRLMRDFHPTHPTFYGVAERIEFPEELKYCRDDEALRGEVEAPRKWPKVSVVVPLYGGPEDIRLCLSSLEASKDLLHETIVVDDVSPDDAADVAARFDFVTLLKNEANAGFAATCNRGYFQSTGDVVLFLNSDTAVPRSGLIRLIETLMSSHTVGAVGPRTNHCAGPQQLQPTYGHLGNLNLFAQDFAHREAKDRDSSLLIGFCLAARRSALEEVEEEPGKAFDERFGRGTYEDNDLSYRLLRAGYKLRISERSYVHHGGSHSLKRVPGSLSSLLRHNGDLYHAKWQDDLVSGFASHLSGDTDAPVVFNQDRHPDTVKEEMARLREQADICLCMIVRDEERVMGDCLRSVAGVFNRIVIVDTGSKDRTVEIVEGFTEQQKKEGGSAVQLVHFPWTESFSEARNESLKYARGRWVFWLDADDTLPRSSAETILRAAVSATNDIVGFVVPVRFVDGGAAGGTQVDHVKLFRNVPGLKFEGRIHEQILGALRDTGGQIARMDAVVLHSGYDTSVQGQAKKRARDEVLLKLDLEERPGHPFVLFNLGMTAHYLGGHQEAIDWLSQSISVAGPTESHVRKAYALMGLSRRELGDLEGALATYAAGLNAVGEDPELRFQMALVLSAQGRWEEARAQYLSMTTDVSGFFSSVDMGILGPKRSHNLATVCLALDRYNEAKEQLAEAIRHGFVPSAQVLHEAAMAREDFRTAREALEAWRSLDPRDPVWAEALVAFSNARGEDPEQALRAYVEAPGAAMVLARRMLARGEEPFGLLQMLDEEGYAEAAFFRGVAANQRGSFEEALAHMRRALSLNPAHEATREQVGRLESALCPTPGLATPEQLGHVAGSHVGAMGGSSCPVSVCIVTYNSASTISACLSSVLSTIGAEDEVVVVDNASSDESADIVDSLGDSRIRLERNAENLGYAKGMNQALLASRGEHLVLLNPDTVVFPGWIEGMRSRLVDNVALVGPISDLIGGNQAVHKFIQSRPPRERLPETVARESAGITVRTKFLTGVCLMSTRETFDKYGLLDEGMEMGADDLELSWRLRVLGHDLAIAGDVFISHEGSVSFESMDPKEKGERVARSDAALVAKLRKFYEETTVPSSWALWDCNIFENALASAG